MAGVITALKIQKKNKERVNVFVDEEFASGGHGDGGCRACTKVNF